MIEWLARQPVPVATFLGTLAGSLFGLVAILAGALFNAHLNRKRDDRLRDDEARALRTALIGELIGLRDAFNVMTAAVEKNNDPAATSGFLIPDVALGARLMPLLLPKFGLLSSDLIRQVIDAYLTVDQFRDKLLLLADGNVRPDNDARGGFVNMPVRFADTVGSLARGTAQKIEATISSLRA